MTLRVCVEREVVVEFHYSRVVQLFVDSVFSACVSEINKQTQNAGYATRGEGPFLACHSLVIVFLFLIPPVFVELVDFDRHVPLLC